MGIRTTLMVTISVVFAMLSAPTWAKTITDEFYINSYFSKRHIDYWSSLEGKRSYLFDFYSASYEKLNAIDKLKGVDRLRIEVRKYPTLETMEVWKRLAAKGTTFIALDTRLPNFVEIEMLNQIGFKAVVFVIREFPTPAEMKVLQDLEMPISITFFGSRYPDYSEIFTFQEIPMGVPLLFSQDYWLGYSHMDFLNIVNGRKDSPHPIRFRVVNAAPSDRNFELLFNTMGLKSVIYVTDFDSFLRSNSNKTGWDEIASKTVWEQFGDLPVNWTVKGYIPSAKQLLEFAQSEVEKETRRITVDLDYELTTEQKKRLEELSVPVHRIRTAPNPR